MTLRAILPNLLPAILTLYYTDLKPDCSSELGVKKKKSTTWFAFKRPNTTFKKMSPKKKVSLRVIFFFSALPNFFFLGHDGNRFRLVELGGVEPLRKLFRQKLEPGTENKKSQEI